MSDTLKIFGQTFTDVAGIKAMNASDVEETYVVGSGGDMSEVWEKLVDDTLSETAHNAEYSISGCFNKLYIVAITHYDESVATQNQYNGRIRINNTEDVIEWIGIYNTNCYAKGIAYINFHENFCDCVGIYHRNTGSFFSNSDSVSSYYSETLTSSTNIQSIKLYPTNNNSGSYLGAGTRIKIYGVRA